MDQKVREIEDHFKDRHPSTQHMMKVLVPNPNLPAPQSEVATQCWTLALSMCTSQEDGPELTAGLRKLLEAKDCFVRNSLGMFKVTYTDR